MEFLSARVRARAPGARASIEIKTGRLLDLELTLGQWVDMGTLIEKIISSLRSLKTG